MSLRNDAASSELKFADHSRVGWGYTYFVRHRDAIKIGFTGAPKRRINQIQISFPDPLDVMAVVPTSIVDEPTAHKKFAHLRRSGEWFDAAPELIEFIKRVKAAADSLPQREYPTPETLEKRGEVTRAQYHLARLRPHYPSADGPIRMLTAQIGNFLDNRDALRPMILKSIEQIEAVIHFPMNEAHSHDDQ